MTIEQPTRVLLTCRQFAERFPWPSEAALRAIILDAEKKGFASAIKRYGRRILIDSQEFFVCLDRLQEKGGSKCQH